MNMAIMAILAAFLWRLRGGLLNNITGQANYRVLGVPFNDTVVRGIWSLGMGGAFWLTHPLPYWRAGLLLVALFGGATLGWFGAALYPAKWRDVGLLSFSGMLRMTPVALVLLNPWPLLAGLLFGPAYWLASKLPDPKPWMFWGEFLTGAVIGACLAVS